MSGELTSKIREWVAAGLLTDEQASRLEAYEESHLAPTSSLSRGAEVATYIGVVLVVISGGVLVSRLWHGMGFGGRLGVGLLVAAIGFLAGMKVHAIPETATQRLGRFLWLGGTGGIAMTVALAVERLSHDGAVTAFFVGLSITTISGLLWRNLDRTLQFLATGVGFILMMVGTVGLTHWHPSRLEFGVIAYGCGLAFAAAALTRLHPRFPALVIAQVTIFSASLTLLEAQREVGVVAGLLGTGAAVALGIWQSNNLLLGIGVITFFVVMARSLTMYLHGPLAIAIAFFVGIVIVVVGLRRVVHPRSSHQPPVS